MDTNYIKQKKKNDKNIIIYLTLIKKFLRRNKFDDLVLLEINYQIIVIFEIPDILDDMANNAALMRFMNARIVNMRHPEHEHAHLWMTAQKPTTLIPKNIRNATQHWLIFRGAELGCIRQKITGHY